METLPRLRELSNQLHMLLSDAAGDALPSNAYWTQSILRCCVMNTVHSCWAIVASDRSWSTLRSLTRSSLAIRWPRNRRCAATSWRSVKR